MDIIDVWFESRIEPAGGARTRAGLPWPADLYLEGGDQHRGWFHSSLLCAMGAQGDAPYRMVATSGWTLDEQGRAMSKSLGNAVDPVDIANRWAREIVRLWVASVDFREDVACFRRPDAARGRKLSQDPQYLPLHSGKSRRIRSADGRGRFDEDASDRSVHAAADCRSGSKKCSAGTRISLSTRSISASTISA